MVSIIIVEYVLAFVHAFLECENFGPSKGALRFLVVQIGLNEQLVDSIETRLHSYQLTIDLFDFF